MEENEELKEAVEKLDSLSADERMQRIADLREKAIMDEKAIYDRGLEIGERKRIEEKIKIVKMMLIKEIDVKDIMVITGLTEEEIKKIDDLTKEEREKMQRIADLREKAIMDEKAIYAKGLDVGIQRGLKEKQVEIAKKMLEENILMEVILKITELTKEELEKLI